MAAQNGAKVRSSGGRVSSFDSLDLYRL
jgi:hypothetical protein